jgi:ribosomal protein S12 methylthiotransferase
MISLGCAKNLVDAEIMLGSVLDRGMEITARSEDADVLVINTCAFIDSAKEESIDAILEAHQQRELGKRPDQKLIVSGCMAQRFTRELRESLPEVDAFIGLDQVSELGGIIESVVMTTGGPGPNFVTPRPTYIPDYDTPPKVAIIRAVFASFRRCAGVIAAANRRPFFRRSKRSSSKE